MKKISINGIELAYERHGKGASLILLHGYPLDHHLWNEVVPILKDTFDLIIPDLRGFGESTTVDTPYTMNDFASDLAGLLDQLGIQKAAIAGHSMGGYVALAYARLYPERVSAFALVSSQVLADPPDRKEGRYKSAADVAPELEPLPEIETEEPPTIIRRKKFDLIPMAEEEAIEQMKLLGHDNFFIFNNAKADAVNVLYRRRDGTYGLIEPHVR